MFPDDTRVLVIDDMAAIRLLMKNMLKVIGLSNISEAGDGEEALDLLLKCQKNGKPIDLIISDWNMPKINGLDLFKIIRAMDEFKHVPFIMVTSESEREQVTEAILAGVSNFVVKPFTIKVIEEKLKAVWAKLQKAGLR